MARNPAKFWLFCRSQQLYGNYIIYLKWKDDLCSYCVSLYTSFYKIMCTELLQHAKWIQNDQKVQPVLAYLFFNIICISCFFFSVKKEVLNLFFLKNISKQSGLFLHSFENIDRNCNRKILLSEITNPCYRTMLNRSLSDTRINWWRAMILCIWCTCTST